MSPLDEITKLLAGLSLGNSCIKTLESLRILLASVNTSELREYIPKIDVNRLFTCLNTNDREQIKLTCETLSHILNIMPKGQALIRYEDVFLEGLVHPTDQVKELIISQLQAAADDKETAHQLSSRLELLLSNLCLVGSDDISIASKASNVLVSLINQGDAANVLVSAPVVEEMRLIASKSDTVRFRVYDLIITLCCAAEEKLAFCEEAQLLQPFLGEVSTGDILVQLNALELLRTLAACQHGRNYLENKGTFQKLAENLNQATVDPLASLIVPGLMKFFGSAAHFQPDLMARYPNFTDTMFNLIDDSDISLAIIAVETLSFIATGVGGKQALNEQGNRMDKAMKRIGQLVCHANGDVRVKAMHSLAELIRIPPNQISDEELLKITEKWFGQLDAKPIPLILNVMKQPFKDLRYASLDIFLQLSPQFWAQKIMSQQPGFIEFLLDRRAEPDKECLERKFEIVKSLSETANPEATDVWTAYALAQMRDHVREGPWFIRAQSSVAFESGP